MFQSDMGRHARGLSHHHPGWLHTDCRISHMGCGCRHRYDQSLDRFWNHDAVGNLVGAGPVLQHSEIPLKDHGFVPLPLASGEGVNREFTQRNGIGVTGLPCITLAARDVVLAERVFPFQPSGCSAMCRHILNSTRTGSCKTRWLTARSEAPSLAHFVRSLVGMDRTAAQSAFSQFLSDRSLTSQQIRFVEMVIDQLTARGVMDASALYEPPFSNLHAGGPDELFAGKEKVIDAVFKALKSLEPRVQGVA